MKIFTRIGSSFVRQFIRFLPAGKRITMAKLCYRLVEENLSKNDQRQLRKAILDVAFGGLRPSWTPTETWAGRKFAYDRFMSRFTMQSSYDMSRAYGFTQLLSMIKQVPGDIVECGVGHGKSLTILIYGAQILQLDKTIYGFDSFAGFPEATVEDLGPRVSKIEKPAGWKAASPETIEAIIATDRQRADSILSPDDEYLQIIPGFFADTLPHHLPEQIAFLHIDCDLYPSTLDVLKHCLPRVSSGGLVIFDEYQDPKWPGATKAIDEVGARWQLEPVFFPHIDRYGWQL
jgi:hypothetical protein